MSESNRSREFWSLPIREYPSDEDLTRNPVQPALDTLFSEFARRHRSLSPSAQSSARSVRGQGRPPQQQPNKASTIDLRALEYTADYDSHLMCPICHVPFIDPVVLECDHTFCGSCLNEYKRGVVNNEGSQCPSCRTFVLSNPRRASRLISNMCNDIKVYCPNEGCKIAMARAYIERHATRDCPEQKMACPDAKCERQTKRKNYVPAQCVHNAQVACDCGAVIELGRGEWLKHKDQDCPNTGHKCEHCGQRVSSPDHACRSDSDQERCPGRDFGCTDEVAPDDLKLHVSKCTYAHLAPYLRSQSRLLQTMQEQVSSSKLRNQALETELERVNDLLASQIQPRLDSLALASQSSDSHHGDHLHDHENDIEEIPRDNIPSAAAIHHRDLLLPAHIRDLTPSPDPFAPPARHHQSHIHVQNQAHMHNHLLSLHENLRHTVSNMEADIHTLHHAIAELDARTSMQIMNETLRIKEDLAYTNAALVSHRSQVQWLLNRERMGREQAILRERGRIGAQAQQSQAQAASEMERQASNLASPGFATQQQQAQQDTFPFPSAGAGMTRTVSGGGGPGSGSSSAATSPMFTGVGMVGSTASTRRPSIRGGSQERVKL